MTLQEIFTKVATHLLSQNSRSKMEDNDNCAYRGKDGKMCAVGCLIKDEHYQPNLELKTVTHPKVQIAVAKSGVTIDDSITRMLGALQSLHDYSEPSTWKERLKELAISHNLEMP